MAVIDSSDSPTTPLTGAAGCDVDEDEYDEDDAAGGCDEDEVEQADSHAEAVIAAKTENFLPLIERTSS